MESIVEKLLSIVRKYKSVFSKLTDEDWNYQSTPNKWSKKEILGHLIDSATNNHQRFVRIQFEDNPRISYDQNNWVFVQDYKNANIENLIELWVHYNQHLAHVINTIPKDKYSKTCNIKMEEPVTLEWLILDYLRHLEHHLNQI